MNMKWIYIYIFQSPSLYYQQKGDKAIFFESYLQALILLTNGKQTKDQGRFTPLREASQPLRNKGVKIYVVGVGSDDDIDVNELIQIAGSHENVITTDLFEELVVLAEEVSKVVCGRKIPLNL